VKTVYAIAITLLALTIPTVAVESTARVVRYHANDIIAVRAKLRYTTMIQVPATEKILEVATGDKDFWIIDAVQNFCFLHPAKSGIHSNLNLITDKGNVYTFTLDEVDTNPDLKIVVVPADSALLVAATGSPQLVPVSEVDGYKAQVQLAHLRTEEAINQFKSEYPTKSVKFDYLYKSDRPFEIAAIYHDDRFTYIKSDAAEKFTIYEIKDDKPNLVEFQLRDGTYVLPKIVDKGYLEIGKKHMNFERRAAAGTTKE